jgi:hypothetical protein
MNGQLGLFAPAAPTVENIDLAKAFASYSADVIAEHGRVRKPVSCGGDLWVSTGGSGTATRRNAKLYRLVSLAEFDGEPTTYREKISIVHEGDEYAGDYARNDPNGFYHGMTVKSGGSIYILCGPPQTVAGDDIAPLFAADDADEEEEELCDGLCPNCGAELEAGTNCAVCNEEDEEEKDNDNEE